MSNENMQKRNPAELKPHPKNPRGEIDTESPGFLDFVEDIRRRGIIQPIVITPDNRILAGHRRREAAIAAGLETVQVVIRELKKGEFAEDFFIAENMQRQDLSPLEEARAIFALQSKLERKTKRVVSQKDLSRRLNLSTAVIRERLAILEMPERVQKLFHIAEIPLNSATKLLKLKDFPEEIEKFADRLATRQISLKNLDTLIIRRLPALNEQLVNEKTLERQPKLERIQRRFPENHHTPAVTRQSVLDSLTKDSNRRISLHTVKAVLEQTCCNCGMMGNDSVCLSCPLPKFVGGVIGRSDASNGGWDE